MKAFAIHTIKHPKSLGIGKEAKAGSVFDTDKEEFKKLEAMGAVRVPTDDELALHEAKGGIVDEAPIPVAKSEIPKNAVVAGAPDSGDENDPNSKPKGARAKKTAEKATEKTAEAKDDDI
jgi:hypothetical protein